MLLGTLCCYLSLSLSTSFRAALQRRSLWVSTSIYHIQHWVSIVSSTSPHKHENLNTRKVKDYSNAIMWANQKNSFSSTGPCGDHSIVYNFTGPILCWAVQIKLEQFQFQFQFQFQLHTYMEQWIRFRSGPSEKTSSHSRSSSPKTKILVLVWIPVVKMRLDFSPVLTNLCRNQQSINPRL